MKRSLLFAPANFSELHARVRGRFFRNFSWTIVGNLGYAGCQFGVLVLLARVAGPIETGVFALGLAITAPLALVLGLALRNVQATDVRETFSFEEYLGLRVITGIVLMISCAAVAFGFDYDRTQTAVIVVLGVGKVFDGISDVNYGHFQRKHRLDQPSKVLLFNGIMSLSLVFVALILTGDAVAAAVANTVASALAAVLSLALVWRFRVGSSGLSWKIPKRERLMALARLSLPLGIATGITSLNLSLPRIMGERIEGVEAIGIYSAIAYLAVAGNTVVGASAQVLLPRFAELFASGHLESVKRLLRTAISTVAVGTAAAFLILSVWGSNLLRILYGLEYEGYGRVLLWVVASASLMFATWFLDYALTASRRFAFHTPISLITMTAIFAAGLILIPRAGLEGIAQASFVGAAVHGVAKWIAVARILGSAANDKAGAKP